MSSYDIVNAFNKIKKLCKKNYKQIPFSPGFKFGLSTRRVLESIALSIGNLNKFGFKQIQEK